MLAAFKTILPYFTEEEVNRFKTICVLAQIPPHRAMCSSKLDVLWLPFLKRLNNLDPAVSMNPPCSGDIGPWRYERFILGYERIMATQKHDIAYLRENHRDLVKIFLDPLKLDGLSLLQQLEKRHGAIERIKIALSMVTEQEGQEAVVLPEPSTKPLLVTIPLVRSPEKTGVIDCGVIAGLKKLKI